MPETQGELSGRRFGGYDVLDFVGTQKGMDRYRARQISLDRLVDLTVLSPGTAQRQATVARFDRVLSVLVRLRHENVLASIDAGEIAGTRFFVTEHLEGSTLADVLARGEEMPLNRALELTHGVARAITHLHEAGVVHREVGPSAIVVSPIPGVPAKLTGFLWAKASERDSRETWFDAESESAAYVSPDRIRGGVGLDWRADVYSLGCVLYRLSTGRPPFHGLSAAATLDAHLARRPRDPRTLVADLPAGLVHVLDRCLRKEPDRRYPTPGDLVRDLAALRASGVPPTPDAAPLLWPTRPAASNPARRPRLGLDRSTGVVARRALPRGLGGLRGG